MQNTLPFPEKKMMILGAIILGLGVILGFSVLSRSLSPSDPLVVNYSFAPDDSVLGLDNTSAVSVPTLGRKDSGAEKQQFAPVWVMINNDGIESPVYIDEKVEQGTLLARLNIVNGTKSRILLKSLALKKYGSLDVKYLKNFKLYTEEGKIVGLIVSNVDMFGYVTWKSNLDFSIEPNTTGRLFMTADVGSEFAPFVYESNLGFGVENVGSIVLVKESAFPYRKSAPVSLDPSQFPSQNEIAILNGGLNVAGVRVPAGPGGENMSVARWSLSTSDSKSVFISELSLLNAGSLGITLRGLYNVNDLTNPIAVFDTLLAPNVVQIVSFDTVEIPRDRTEEFVLMADVIGKPMDTLLVNLEDVVASDQYGISVASDDMPIEGTWIEL